jgi:hypothetical protein
MEIGMRMHQGVTQIRRHHKINKDRMRRWEESTLIIRFRGENEHVDRTRIEVGCAVEALVSWQFLSLVVVGLGGDAMVLNAEIKVPKL